MKLNTFFKLSFWGGRVEEHPVCAQGLLALCSKVSPGSVQGVGPYVVLGIKTGWIEVANANQMFYLLYYLFSP